MDTTNDVTEKLEIFNSPFTRGTYGKNVWDMQVFDGKVYIGQGNSSNVGIDSNIGAIPVHYFDPNINTFIQEYTVNEEQIDKFKIINDELYILGHDPKDSWEYGNFYRRVNGMWEKVRTVPYGLHMYDMTYYNGILFVAIGTTKDYSTLYYSKDMGQNWIACGEPSLKRMFNVFTFKGQVYALNTARVPHPMFNGINFLKRFNGDVFVNYSDSNKLINAMKPITMYDATSKLNISHYAYKLIRVNEFVGNLVYIIGIPTNDHQTKPVKMFSTTEVHLNAKPIELPETNAVPTDILIRNDEIYVCTYIKKSNESYVNIVYKSNDLVVWNEVMRFNAKTFARSFEELDGNFYFGLGAELDYVSVDCGKIVKVNLNELKEDVVIINPVKTNVALGKSVKVDSVYMNYKGENAVNGDAKTNEGRWLSANTNTQHFIEIDLGGLCKISEIRTYFGWNGYNRAPKQYKLKYWDGKDWITHVDVINNQSATPTDTFPEITTNKVRWETDVDGYVRMYEIELMGYETK